MTLYALFNSVKETIISSAKDTIVYCVPSLVECHLSDESLTKSKDTSVISTLTTPRTVVAAKCASQGMVAAGYLTAKERSSYMQYCNNTDSSYYISPCTDELGFRVVDYWSPEDDNYLTYAKWNNITPKKTVATKKLVSNDNIPTAKKGTASIVSHADHVSDTSLEPDTVDDIDDAYVMDFSICYPTISPRFYSVNHTSLFS